MNRKYRCRAERILINFINAAEGQPTVKRATGKYSIQDVRGPEIDSIMEAYKIPVCRTGTGSSYYRLEDLQAGYQRLRKELEAEKRFTPDDRPSR